MLFLSQEIITSLKNVGDEDSDVAKYKAELEFKKNVMAIQVKSNKTGVS